MTQKCLTSRVVWCLATLVLVLGVALTVTAQQAPAPIQIAWSGPLTGDVAQLGQGYLNGIKLAFDEWNAKGGILGGRKFTVVAEDDACDPKQAGTTAQKIADDPKNVVFIGHMCSGTTLAGSPIINKVNLPQVTLSSNPKITQQGWKNLFRPIANDNIQGKAGVAFVMRKFNAKKFALLNDKQAFGQGVTEVAKATIEKAGGSVTSTGGVEPKDVDYSAVLTKIIKTENPDAIVYCTNFNTSAGLLVKQVRQLGYKKPVIGCDGYYDPGMPKAAGAAGDMKSDQEAVYLTFQTPPYSGPGAPEKVKQFAEKFKAKYKNDPAGYDIYGYDFANIIANAIVKAGSTDKEKIIDVMHKSSVPGLLIPEYKFDENGDVVNGPLYIYTVDKGNFKLVEQWKE
jgi:branched-chain amino acid transport system substrate-binding protein